jgi:hypothetical protein
LVRIGPNGQPDSVWASAFIDDVEDWDDADTYLGWDENNQTICVMNGTTILPYNVTLDKPGAPCDISTQVTGDIVGCVTQLGSLYIACLDVSNTTIKLYKFNSGTGSITEVYTDWMPFRLRGRHDPPDKRPRQVRHDEHRHLESLCRREPGNADLEHDTYADGRRARILTRLAGNAAKGTELLRLSQTDIGRRRSGF